MSSLEWLCRLDGRIPDFALSHCFMDLFYFSVFVLIVVRNSRSFGYGFTLLTVPPLRYHGGYLRYSPQ